MTLLTAKESIQALVAFKGMAADQKALASIEVKMEEIPEGQVVCGVPGLLHRMNSVCT